jgi:hypothetical protein
VFREFGVERFLRLEIHPVMEGCVFGGKGHSYQKQTKDPTGSSRSSSISKSDIIGMEYVQPKERFPGILTLDTTQRPDKTVWSIGDEVRIYEEGISPSCNTDRDRGCFSCRFKHFLSGIEYLDRRYTFVHAKDKHLYVWAEGEYSQEEFLEGHRRIPAAVTDIRNWHIPPAYNCIQADDDETEVKVNNAVSGSSPTSCSGSVELPNRCRILPSMTLHKYKARLHTHAHHSTF